MSKFRMSTQVVTLSCGQAIELIAAMEKGEDIGAVNSGLLLAHIAVCADCGRKFEEIKLPAGDVSITI